MPSSGPATAATLSGPVGQAAGIRGRLPTHVPDPVDSLGPIVRDHERAVGCLQDVGRPSPRPPVAVPSLGKYRVAQRGVVKRAMLTPMSHKKTLVSAPIGVQSARRPTVGVPVVLLYLGFLDAVEMKDRGSPFEKDDDWRRTLLGALPRRDWCGLLGKDAGRRSTPLLPLIRTDGQPFDPR